MFKLLLFIVLVLLTEDIHGCIPMKIIDPITIPVTSTSFPPFSCSTPPDQAGIYIEDGVVLTDNDDFRKTNPTGTCISSTGVITYYDGRTSDVWFTNDRVFVGQWIHETCTTPCVCTATACYTPQPPPLADPSQPDIFLYPHCISPENCFVALTFNTRGRIVNPLNPTDEFTYDAQADGIGDVTTPEYPRITRIGCSRCPL